MIENKNVRVIDGVFKGVEGCLEGVNWTPSQYVSIKVDDDNIIVVATNRVEFTDEEYLIYVTDLSTNKVSSKYLPYIIKMNRYKITDYIFKIHKEIEPREKMMELRHSNCNNVFAYKPNHKFNVTATPLSSVKTEFKINGKEIDVNSLKNIINHLK